MSNPMLISEITPDQLRVFKSELAYITETLAEMTGRGALYASLIRSREELVRAIARIEEGSK